MLNAKILKYDETGLLQHQLAAARFTHFPLTNLTTMATPEMRLGNNGAGEPWQITSAEGRILPGSAYREEIIELWTRVLAEKRSGNGKFVNIQTDSLTIYPERDYAETDAKVYIDNETGRTTAAGMKAYLDTGRFMFFSGPGERVITIFLPN